MRGYPKHIATKQDYLNLTAMPEHREQALKDLAVINDAKDENVLESTGIAADGSATTKEIENPMPLWKAKGFRSLKEVTDMIAAVEVANV